MATDWLSIIADLGSTYLGAKEAKDKSDNTMSPKDIYNVGNPSYFNPFQSRTSDWNRGNPSITQEFSPQVMELINQWVGRSEKAGEGRTPYGMNDGMRDVYGAQQNWQRERFGLPPTSRPEQYDPYGGANSQTGGTVGNITNPDSSGSSDSSNSLTGEDIPPNYAENYITDNERAYDEIQRTVMLRDAENNSRAPEEFDYMDGSLDWLNQRGQFDPNNSHIPFNEDFGGYGSNGLPTGFDGGEFGEDILRLLVPALANAGIPFTGNIADYIMDQFIIGDQAGIMSPSSPDFVDPNGSRPQDRNTPPTERGNVGYADRGVGEGGGYGNMSGGYGSGFGRGSGGGFDLGNTGGGGGFGGMGWGSGGRMGGGFGAFGSGGGNYFLSRHR